MIRYEVRVNGKDNDQGEQTFQWLAAEKISPTRFRITAKDPVWERLEIEMSNIRHRKIREGR